MSHRKRNGINKREKPTLANILQQRNTLLTITNSNLIDVQHRE